MVDFNDYQPVSSPASMPAAPAAPADATAPEAPIAAVPAPALPRFVEVAGRPRSRTIMLEFPIEYGGRTYHLITVRRPDAAEVGQFFERLRDEPPAPDKRIHFPLFVDEDGAPVPDIVLDRLDGDDDEDVQEAALNFLPRRLRRFADLLRND